MWKARTNSKFCATLQVSAWSSWLCWSRRDEIYLAIESLAERSEARRIRYVLYSRKLYDAKCKLGTGQLENVTAGIEGFSMAIFTRVLGWTKPEVDVFLADVFLADVKKEIRDTTIHVYSNMWVLLLEFYWVERYGQVLMSSRYVVYGCKPG